MTVRSWHTLARHVAILTAGKQSVALQRFRSPHSSPFDISTSEDRKSNIQKKIEADFNRLLNQVVVRDIPFLGACSGNGLLGNYLGNSISTKYGGAVSCVTLDLTEAGKQDKLLTGFPEQIDVLLGHNEAVDTTPDGAALLMTGSDCPVQMFRVGENVYATQFHPKATPRNSCCVSKPTGITAISNRMKRMS